MPKFEDTPNLNNAGANPNEKGADLGAEKKPEGGPSLEEPERLKRKEGRRLD